jgi:large subunit ribosomal protein L30
LDKARQTIWIRQIRSGIGCPHKHKVLLRCLGLTRLHKLVERPGTPQILGMVAKVQHLVEVVKPSDLAVRTFIPAFTLCPPEVVPVEAVSATGTVEEGKEAGAVVELTDTPAPAAKAAVKPVGKAPKPVKAETKHRAEQGKGKASEKAEAKKAAAGKSKAVKSSKTAKK